MNVMDLFSIPRFKTPDKPALEFVDPQTPAAAQTYTYAELFDAAERVARSLANWGLEKGDRVAFFVGNRPEFIVAYLAVLQVGGVLVPINLRYRAMELTHILNDCRPRLLITERQHQSILRESGIEATPVERILTVEELDALPPAESPRLPQVDGSDLAMILYTSGTTGRSKGAMISHNNVLATVTGLLAAWAWEADDRLLLCLPLFHTHGLVVGLHCALAAGAKILLCEKYTADHTLDELAQGKATLFFAVPTIYTRLVGELKARPHVNLAQMRLFCSGSAPLDPETFDAFHELTGHRILERYGMTETGMNLSNLYAGPRLAGTVGVPLPGVEMRIVDSGGKDVENGAEGELLVRGSNVFAGYWEDSEKTAASFSHDAQGFAWFHTGDLARRDPQTGFVTLLGRKHELIISGGFNIYPREIEELLLTCPGVVEVAVVGRPDAEWGECPVAYLICEEGVHSEFLVAFCRKQLASFKIPREFIRVESLPRNAMGKLQKHLLGGSG